MDIDFSLTPDNNGNTGVRGELMLSFSELRRIQQYFKDNSYNYGFELSPEPINDYYNKKNIKKKLQSANGRCLLGVEINTENDKKRLRNSRPSYSRELKALLEDGFNILESRSEVKQSNFQNDAGNRGVSDDPLKRMPDWAKRFYRILKIISQQEIFKPYVANVNINNFNLYLKGQNPENSSHSNNSDGDNDREFNYNEEIDRLFHNANSYFKYLKNCSPIKPISLSKIIKKLENNEYVNAANVFSDIYSVWICAFRSEKPDGFLWSKTMDACLNFNLKLINEPLQDDFSLTFPCKNKGNKSKDDRIYGGPSSKKANTGKNTLYNDKNNKETYTSVGMSGSSGVCLDYLSNSKNKKLNQGQSNTNKSNNKGSKRSATGGHSSSSGLSNSVISESERREFQSLLGKLSQNDHVELFNSFLSTAHWKEVSTGEVELDDQQTPPDIFREMIKWCKVKLNIPVLDNTTSKGMNNGKKTSKKCKQSKVISNDNVSSNKKKTQLSAKQFFSTGRAFSSPSDSDDDISSFGNLQMSQQWESTSSSGESENEPELTSFFPHFNSK